MTVPAREAPAAQLLRSQVIVPEWGMESFRKRLAALNRKGEGYGIPEITVLSESVRPYRTVEEDSERGTWYRLEPIVSAGSGYGHSVVHMHAIELQYPIIKLGNWDVLAQLEAAPGGKLAFTASRDPQDMAQVMGRVDKPICCEHCNAQRNRKLGFLLKDRATGAYKEVGSTCLEDFTGVDPAKALFMAKMATFVGEEGDPLAAGIGQRGDRIPVRDYLINTLFLIEQFGFLSAARAAERMEPATYKQAEDLRWLFKRRPELRAVFAQAQERLGHVADGMVTWYASMKPDTPYAVTAKSLLASSTLKLEARHLAYVAGAVPGYLRTLNQQQLVPSEGQRSTHQGAAGEAMTRNLAVLRVIVTPTQFGDQYRLVMRDGGGNEFCWKTGKPVHELLRVESCGRPFAASFKIKEHSVFNDTAVTYVTHLKFNGWELALDAGVATAAEVDEEHDDCRPRP